MTFNKCFKGARHCAKSVMQIASFNYQNNLTESLLFSSLCRGGNGSWERLNNLPRCTAPQWAGPDPQRGAREIRLHQLPAAAVTNHRQRGALNKTGSDTSAGPKADMGLAGLKPRCQQGWRLQRRIRSLAWSSCQRLSYSLMCFLHPQSQRWGTESFSPGIPLTRCHINSSSPPPSPSPSSALKDLCDDT